jgi:hypothetical protein
VASANPSGEPAAFPRNSDRSITVTSRTIYLRDLDGNLVEVANQLDQP